MLSWCIAGLLAAAVAVAVRWCLRRTDALGRPRRFPVVSVALLVSSDQEFQTTQEFLASIDENLKKEMNA